MPRFLDNGLVSITALVGVSSAFREVCYNKLEPFRRDIQALALVDTGATTSCVDEELLKSLRITEKDSMSVSGFSGPSQKFPTYDVWLKVITRTGETIMESEDLRVIGTDLGSRDYKVIIGMDLLHCFTIQLLRETKLAELFETAPPYEISVGSLSKPTDILPPQNGA